MEVVGTFGGFTETGPFLNVQTDTLDLHILHDEVADAFAVEKIGHDSTATTRSLQFFDRAGDAAFKVFLWEDFPNVPAARVEAFEALVGRFRAAPADALPAPGSSRPGPCPCLCPPPTRPRVPGDDARRRAWGRERSPSRGGSRSRCPRGPRRARSTSVRRSWASSRPTG